MYTQQAVPDDADRPIVPRKRRSLIGRIAAHLRGDRYMVNAYPPATSDAPEPARTTA